ncbi:MAG: Lrp/AsnC family transcriptional regulator [Saprospiraceae bacterium]
MDYKLDPIDHRILELLQKDGKMKIKEIAEILHMTNTPVFDRIKRLEREGIIKGYTAKIDKAKTGYPLMAFCSVRLESHHTDYLEQFVREIKKFPEIEACYHMAGVFDYLLKLYAKDMDDYQQFITKKLATIPNIGRVQSSFVMTEIV